MMEIEGRLADMGLTLPPPLKVPPGVKLPFSFVRIHRGIAYISGHGPQTPMARSADPSEKSAPMSRWSKVTKRRRGLRCRCLAASNANSAISIASAPGCACTAWSIARRISPGSLP